MKTKRMNKQTNPEQSFKEVNKRQNVYYEKFSACKKSWLFGALVGLVIAVLSGFCFTGFEICVESVMFMVLMFVLTTWIMASIFGLKYTSDFGFSVIAARIADIGLKICGFFVGTYVLAGVAAVLFCIFLVFFLIAFLLFAAVFPLEMLYYWIRYSIAKTTAKEDLVLGYT